MAGLIVMMMTERGLALLNNSLNGSIEGAYIYTDLDQGAVKSSTHGIEQRYNLRYFQNLFDSRLGAFGGAVNWVDDQTNFSAPIDQTRRYLVKDYNLNLSLFPRSAPLTLFAQKTERENQTDSILHDTMTTYGFGWLFTPANFPRLGINGIHTRFTSDQLGSFPTTETDSLTVDTGGRWGSFNINARYLYNQTESEGGDSTWAHGVNLNLNGAVTQALTLGAYANYVSRGGNSSGMNFFQENALGLNLFYVPNRLWDGNLRFDFNESPGSVDLKRYLVSVGLNLHPTSKLDILNGAQYTRFDTGLSRTDSLFANTGLNFRPIFGLTLAAGLGGGITKLTGSGASSKNEFGHANGSVSYFKILPVLRVNAAYAGSIAMNDSDSTGRSTDTTHTFSAGVDNTRTEIIHVGVNGVLTLLHRETPGASDNQRETRLSASADSRYFRELIFHNDQLLLDGTLTYLDVTGFGVEGKTVSEDFHASYQFLNMFSLLAAFSHIEYPGGYYGSSVNIASVDFLGTVRPWVNGLWTFSLKEIVNESQTLSTQKTFNGQTRLSHQLGRLTLSTEYGYNRTDAGSVGTISQQFVVRAVRPF